MLLAGAGVEAKKLHTIGDSTMDSYVGSDTEKLGWGAPLQQFMNGTDTESKGITVNNRGKSGASTRTFYTDSRFWATMVTGGSDAMQEGDILLIQFAHNDENNKGVDALELKKYNEEHSLEAITDLRGTTPTTTYKENLRKYIDEAQKMGVKPILVSAMCRNYFDGATIKASGRHNLKDGYNVLTESGLQQNQKLATDDHSMDYTYQMEQVALEYEDVPYINMTEATATMFEKLGSSYCNANIFNVGDGTHTCPLGATLVARCFAITLLETAKNETNAKRKAVLDELAQYVSLSSDIALTTEKLDFGKVYVGTPVVKSINVAGFDIEPATGTYSISVTEGFEVSIDGKTFATEQTPAYEGGSIFATISVRGTAMEEGEKKATLTVSCGSLSKTAEVSMTGIMNTTGTESQVVWSMNDGEAKADKTGELIAGEEVISGMVEGDPTYQEIDGVKYRRYKTAEAWPDQMDEVSDRYIQFSAEVPEGKNFRLDKIELDVAAVATTYMRCRIYYATKEDFTDAVQVKEFTSMSSNKAEHVSAMPMKTLNAGDKVYIRVYPWMQGESAADKYIALKNVTIHGYAEEVLSSIIWRFEAEKIENGAAFACRANNVFISEDGGYKLTYKGNSDNDALVKADATIDDVNYTSYVNLNGATSSGRTMSFTGVDGVGTLTIVFAAGKSNSTAVTINEGTYDGTPIATLNAEAKKVDKTALTTGLMKLDGSKAYFINGIRSVYSVIWTPSNEELTDCIVTYYDANGSTILKTETVEGGSALVFNKEAEAAVKVGDGAAFRGWFSSNQTSATKVQEGVPVNANMSLYAKVTEIEVATVGSIWEYNLKAANFYPEDHELITLGGKYHGDKHGWVLSNGQTMQIEVAGNAIVRLGLCEYANEADITVRDGKGNEVAKVPAKVEADGAAASISYQGEATKLTFTMAATAYVHDVKVFNLAGALPEKNEAGYYVLESGDAASLILVLATLKDGDKVFLPNGTYDLGEACLTQISANNVSIIGESMEGTIIRNAPYWRNEAIDKTATIKNTSNGLYMQDLTLQNALDYYAAVDAKLAGARAVCLMDEGANTICKNVRMLSYQDTYYSHKPSNFYWEDCEIHGTVDYLCGDGDVVYNRCLLVNESRAREEGNGECTVAAPYTSASCVWGYVMLDCKIETRSARFNLGRSWGGDSKLQYIRCQDMSNKLIPARWTIAGMNVAAYKFMEYGTTDKDGKVTTPESNVVTFTHSSGNKSYETVLSTDEAAKYTVANIYGEWAPDKTAAQVEAKAAIKDGIITIENEAGAYAIYEDGELKAIQSGKTYTASEGKEYEVRVANGRGGFSSKVKVNAAQGIDNHTNTVNKIEKVVRNGQVVILKNGVQYNVLGTRL